MKKYYGYFVYNDEEYVIRFKIDGSLVWSDEYHCFKDDRWYCYSYRDMISYAAFDTHESNVRQLGFTCGLRTRKAFNEQRARGVKRWKPKQEIIKWY